MLLLDLMLSPPSRYLPHLNHTWAFLLMHRISKLLVPHDVLASIDDCCRSQSTGRYACPTSEIQVWKITAATISRNLRQCGRRARDAYLGVALLDRPIPFLCTESGTMREVVYGSGIVWPMFSAQEVVADLCWCVFTFRVVHGHDWIKLVTEDVLITRLKR